MYKYNFLLINFLLCLGLASCNSSTSVDSETSTDTETDTTTNDDTSTTTGDGSDDTTNYFNSALFNSSFLKSSTEVSCQLENGSTTTCYEIVFTANGVGDTEGDGTIGPYCPDTINTLRSESGVGIYDGPTNPGFQSLVDAAQAMDADGYDIVDDSGNVNFSDLTSMGDADLSYCLSALLDSSLEITYLVPVTPELRSEPYEIGTIDSIGFGLNGVPLKGTPPSVTTVEDGVGGTGSGNIPALDLCGGHPDPSGYYHWHMIPQAMNTLLSSDEYTYTQNYGMKCSNSNIAYDEPAIFSGIAKDGYPIYGAFDTADSVSTQPNDVATVDECNGHTHETAEFPNGAYHYHALENTAPNMPPCLMGSFVSRDFTVR